MGGCPAPTVNQETFKQSLFRMPPPSTSVVGGRSSQTSALQARQVTPGSLDLDQDNKQRLAAFSAAAIIGGTLAFTNSQLDQNIQQSGQH